VQAGRRRRDEIGRGRRVDATRSAAAAAVAPGEASPPVTAAAVAPDVSSPPVTATPAAPELGDADLALALRGLGFTAAEARLGVASAATAGEDAATGTFEQRLRAALAALTRSRTFRCSDGPFDRATGHGFIGTA
jgi:hypothetical protein